MPAPLVVRASQFGEYAAAPVRDWAQARRQNAVQRLAPHAAEGSVELPAWKCSAQAVRSRIAVRTFAPPALLGASALPPIAAKLQGESLRVVAFAEHSRPGDEADCPCRSEPVCETRAPPAPPSWNLALELILVARPGSWMKQWATVGLAELRPLWASVAVAELPSWAS
eukprot:309728-Rhodomonas_salina.3